MKIVLLLAQVLLIGVSSEDTLCQYSGRQWQSIVLHAYERHSYSTRTPYKNWMKCTASYKLADDCGRGIVSCEQFSTIASRGCYWGDFLSIVDTDTGSFKRFCQRKGPIEFKPKGDFKLRFVSNGRKTAKGINCAVSCAEPLRPPVPVDCTLGEEWSNWSSCTAECKQTRNKKVLTPASNGGTCDNPDLETQFCYKDSCPYRCGEEKLTRVQGGTPTSPNQYPWAVVFTDMHWGARCAGALISDQWILTSSDCTDFQIYIIHMLGVHDTKNRDDSLEVTVTEWITNPLSISTGDEGDEPTNLVLGKLDKPVDFSQHGNIRPICLPEEESSSTTYKGISAIVAAWGVENHGANDFYADTLTETTLTLVSEGCKEHSEVLLCGEHSDTTKGPCKNDIGAPLMSKATSGFFQLLGIFTKCPDVNNPGSGAIFFKIAGTQDWIRETIKNNM